MNEKYEIKSELTTEVAQKNDKPSVARLFHKVGDLVGWIAGQFEPIGDNYWRSVHNTGQGKGNHPLS